VNESEVIERANERRRQAASETNLKEYYQFAMSLKNRYEDLRVMTANWDIVSDELEAQILSLEPMIETVCQEAKDEAIRRRDNKEYVTYR